MKHVYRAKVAKKRIFSNELTQFFGIRVSRFTFSIRYSIIASAPAISPAACWSPFLCAASIPAR
jgi:hypothetical protein